MGVKVQRWADRKPLQAGAAALVFSAAVFLGGIAWMNSAEAAYSPNFICQHKTSVLMYRQILSGQYVAQNKITLLWSTNGATCQVGTPGVLTVGSATYWCSWMTSLGYSGTCSGWKSTAGHAEVDARNCWGGLCQNVKAWLDVNRYGQVTYGCAVVIDGHPKDGGYNHCSLSKVY